MHFTKTFVAALMAVTSTSAGVIARDETWSLDGLHRECNDSTCTWNFDIDNHAGDRTSCTHVVNSQDGQPASHSHGGPTFCGVYRLESSWDSHNGPGREFSVIGVLDQSRRVIGYFGYDDAEVPNGRVVVPDHTSTITPFSQNAII